MRGQMPGDRVGTGRVEKTLVPCRFSGSSVPLESEGASWRVFEKRGATPHFGAKGYAPEASDSRRNS